MPTGYTAYIEDGSITTGAEFLMLCSRAFGVAADLRDEPLSVATPEHVEPNTKCRDRYTKAIAILNAALALTTDEAREKMRQSHEEKVRTAKSYLTTLEETNKRYDAVRKQVEAWVPPTKEHIGIKEFALNQIDISVDSDNYLESIRKDANAVLDDSDAAVAEYIAREIKFCEGDVERAKEAWNAEIKRTEKRNLYMRQFLDSLGSIKVD